MAKIPQYKLVQRAAAAATKPRIIEEGRGGHMVMIGRNVAFVNRKAARTKRKDRTFTKKTFNFGRKIGSGEDVFVHRIAERNNRNGI